MKRQRRISRRSFVSMVTGGAVVLNPLFGARSALALQVSDSDSVINDPPGRGRGSRSGITDRDPSDAVGNGRGNSRAQGTGVEPQRPPQQPFLNNNERAAGTGVTDTDPSDPAGYGRAQPQTAPRSPYASPTDRSAPSGITDTDPTDPVGSGRGGTRRRCSDADSGSGADPGGLGRRC